MARTGVYARGTDVRISYNDMDDMGTGVRIENGAQRRLNIENNFITAKGLGIALNQCDPAELIRVSFNFIDFVGNNYGKTGIRVSEMGFGQHDSEINNNIINLSNTSYGSGIAASGIAKQDIFDNVIDVSSCAFSSGLNIYGGGSSDIRCNVVSGTPTSYEQAGLSVINGSYFNFIDNEFHFTNIGARFSGTCNKTLLQTSTFSNNDIGLKMTNSALFGSLTTNQLNTQEHTGNIWQGEFSSGLGALHESEIDQTIKYSRFEVHKLEGELEADGITTYHPWNENGAQIEWFTQSSGTPEEMGTCMPGLFTQGQITKLDRDIAKDSALVDIFPVEVLHTAQKELYRRLSDNPSLIAGDVDLQNFYDEKSTETLGKLVDVDKNTKFIHEVDPSIKGQISSLQSLLEDYQEQLTVLKEALPTNPSKLELNDLKQAQSLIYLQIDIAKTQLEDLHASIKSGKEIEAENVKGSNSDIFVSAIYEENDKVVNDIYLSTVARSNLNFTATQSTQLWLIAVQCPLSGGEAVFKARGLYYLIDPEADFGNDFDICNASGIVLNVGSDDGNQIQQTNTGIGDAVEDNDTEAITTDSFEITSESRNAASFEVIPNPANTVIRINYNELSGSSIFTLCNTLGIPLKTAKMSAGGSQTIDVASLPVGVYWLKAETAGKPIRTTKVLIVR